MWDLSSVRLLLLLTEPQDLKWKTSLRRCDSVCQYSWLAHEIDWLNTDAKGWSVWLWAVWQRFAGFDKWSQITWYVYMRVFTRDGFLCILPTWWVMNGTDGGERANRTQLRWTLPEGRDELSHWYAKGATKITKRVQALDQSIALWGSESAIWG